MSDRPGHIGIGEEIATSADRLAIGELIQLSDGRQARVKALPSGTDPSARVVVELLDPNLQPFQRTIRLEPGTSVLRLGTGRLSIITNLGVETDSRLVPFDQFFGGGSTGTSAPAFSGTSAGLTQQHEQELAFLREQERLATERGDLARAADLTNQIAILERQQEFTREQDRLTREFTEQQNEINRELRLREARLATARDLVNIRSAEAREARTLGVQLAGDDPFRFTAVARGLAGPTGTTPSAGFKQNLATAGSFQAPDLTGLDSNALESVIGKLSQTLTPQQGTFGFAHGGTVNGRSGGTTQPGDGTVALDVGEPINGLPNPEVVILRPNGTVEVVRKMGVAQTGGTFDFGGFGSLFNSLRGSVGVDARRDALPGVFSPQDVLTSGTASLLGARQRGLGSLVRDPTTGAIFITTAQGLRHVSVDALPALTESFGAAENLSAGSLDRLFAGFGRGEQIRGEEARGFQIERPGGTFGAFGSPLSTFGGFTDLANALPGFSQQDAERVSQLIGFLPAPHKIPFSFFQALIPAEKEALVSAYRLAGVPEADFQHLRTAPQLSFAPQRATAVG